MEVNINREVEDSYCRYKMPMLAAKVEGKGNGIKTVIVNVSDIAKSLGRKPMYVTKYFGCELGAQVRVDNKNERYIVNGAHEASRLQALLDGFIKMYVLCQECKNPETTMHVNKKSGTVSTICKACGSHGKVDAKHKLTQYIIKNPPESNSVTKRETKKSRKSKNEVNSGEDHDVSAVCDEGTHSPVVDEHDDDWVEDTTAEAQSKRIKELSGFAQALAQGIEMEISETDRADVFHKHLLEEEKSGLVLSRIRVIKAEADRLRLGPRAVLVLAEVLLSKPLSILADVKKYAPVFTAFTRVGESRERAQHYILGAMAKLIADNEVTLLPKACHILNAFYDNNILEEESILIWDEKGPSKRFVSKSLSAKIIDNCQPFVKWLREAEEEDSDESEEEDVPPVKANLNGCEKPVLQAAEDSNESEDDIDIDAI